MLLRSALWWPGLSDDITKVISSCAVCQAFQNSGSERTLHSWPTTDNVWQRVHIDFFHKNGLTFLIIVDSKSKFLDIHLMSSTNVLQTIEKLKVTFSMLGLPLQLVSDNGPPFNSSEFSKFCLANGIQPVKTPPYHPQSNGAAERNVQTVKKITVETVV
uniref:RNA-directed DNA polymerase n=2 Tax=Photinus pyralis TaxID=7054 RepID=A0A1Y1LXH1_PHOPY